MDEPASRVSVAIRSASERAAARDVAARTGESGKCLRKGAAEAIFARKTRL